MRLLFINILIIVFMPCAVAQRVVVLDSTRQSYLNISDVSILSDTSNTLVLSDIIAPEMSAKFTRNNKKTINLGMSGRDSWLKFPIVNQSGQANWYLEIRFPNLNKVTMYVLDKGGNTLYSRNQGLEFGNGIGESKHEAPLFLLNLPGTEEYQIYFHISTSSALIVPINIYSATKLTEEGSMKNNIVFLLLGILMASVIFNFMLMFLTRETSYLFLALYMGFIVIHSFFIYGYGYVYFDWLSIDLKLKMRTLIYCMIVISHSFFAVYYLNIQKRTFLYRAFISIAILFSLIFTAFLFDLFSMLLFNRVASASYLVLTPFYVGAGIYLYRRGFKPALYYVLAFGLNIVAAILTTSTFLGVYQTSFIGIYSHLFASSFFALVITIGLSEKISALRAERIRTLQLTVDKQHLNYEITEHKATEAALRESESKLIQLNATKDKFFSIIAHDLMNPFHAIIAYSRDMIDDLKTNNTKRLHRNTLYLNDLSENTYSLLSNLLLWSKAQTGQISFIPVRMSLSILMEDSVKLFETIAASKEITLTNNVAGSVVVMADPDMIKTIFRNLISNAVKYTYKGGSVTIDARHNLKYIEISVTDTGTGIDAGKIDKLFTGNNNIKTYGTENEPGTGLGLILCSEFISFHNGSIGVESLPGKGTKFTVRLPASKMIKKEKNESAHNLISRRRSVHSSPYIRNT